MQRRGEDTDWLDLFAKGSPRLCAEGRHECQCYQGGAHGVSQPRYCLTTVNAPT